MLLESGVRSFFTFQEALVSSFRRVVRSGVHQALDRGDGRERCVVASIAALSVERAEGNHWSSWFGKRVSGGEGRANPLVYP